MVVSGVEGSNLTIHFSSSLDIPQAASKVFGLNKNKVIHAPFTFTILVLKIYINNNLFLSGICWKDKHICCGNYN